MARINNIVLVHGAFVDGSSWAGLYDILKEDGFDVSVVQNPTISLEGDVAATNLILDEQVGPAVLVGHSYGGVVITEAGRHPKVAALVRSHVITSPVLAAANAMSAHMLERYGARTSNISDNSGRRRSW